VGITVDICLVAFWGMVDMWYDAMSTLSLMTISVIFSVILGMLLGTIAASSDRFDAMLRPVLDTMQTMPAFVYLIPPRTSTSITNHG